MTRIERIHADDCSMIKRWKHKDLLIMSCEKNGWSPKARRFSSDTEDSISVDFELGNKYSQAKEYYIFGVYDGHGVHDASKISIKCSEHLPENIAKNLSKKPKNKEEDIKNAIKKGFEETELYMKSALVKEAQDSGCTALVAVLGPSRELVIANIGDSPGFISSNEIFSLQITKEHDVHNRAEILRLRQQKKEKDGVGFSIYRLAPGRREKSWASEPEITDKYDANDINLLVLCSDGITNRLRAYKRMPTQVLLSYIKKHINKKDPLEEACHELVKICDLVSQSGYCVDDMSILVIVFLNNKSLKQWCEDATKRAENPEDWLQYKQQKYEEDISDISEEDLGVESPKNGPFYVDYVGRFLLH
ncbi:30776_t:CDS:2 [Gigaspora margarita]|uniref:30776_t:CDS:1 n=1 Tax=Gigaspora margarita TaxID=4874 RepID=A0ABN7UPW4_GIGMA|nr:30776_t:CDS:2 [Gigaspora margarita]